MEENMFVPGYKTPILSDVNYNELESAVNAHNEAAEPGDVYWGILISNGYYEIYSYGTVPEPPTPPTEDEQRETLKAEKLKMASDSCEKDIYSGIDVKFSETSTEHFSLQPNDQTNIDGIFSAITLGATAYPYHADGEPCKMYSASDIVTLYVAAKSYITQKTTYNNALRQWIKREDDIGTLNSIVYGADLPEDLQTDMENILKAANDQVQAIVSKLVAAVSVE